MYRGSRYLKYKNEIKRAKEYTNRALKRLEQESLAPTPPNIELWYVYYANLSQEVKRAIDILVNNEQDITQERCTEIYQRFLSSDGNEDIVRKAGDQIHKTLTEMSDFMKSVRSNTSDFSGKLEDASARITSAGSLDDLEQMMQGLLSETESMLKHNEHLEKELDRSSSQMQELQSNLETIRKEAYTDGLTGLKNRKAFDEEIDKMMQAAEDEGRTFSLLMIDIDHFKKFNDNYGHQIGDQVLRLVAKTLTDSIKGRDTACRFGGEEFAIILPDTNSKSSGIVAEALRRTIGDKDIVNKMTQKKIGKITISVGVAEFKSGEDIESLIERADAALYTAKRSGRDRVAVAPLKKDEAARVAG